MRWRALMRKWCWQEGQTCRASSTTLRKSISSHSGQRIQRPSGMPSLRAAVSLGSWDILVLSLGIHRSKNRAAKTQRAQRREAHCRSYPSLRTSAGTLSAVKLTAQGGDRRLAIGRIEDGAADDEPIDAGVARLLDGFEVNAAVDWETLLQPQAFFDGLALGEDFGHELLPAEAGDDAHDQDEVDVIEGGEDALDGRGGVERDADGAAELFDILGGLGGIIHGFYLEGDVLCACLDHRGGVTDGVGDHDVNVEEGGGDLARRFDDGRAEGDVGDEVDVHDVEVEEVCAAREDILEF